jgi:hypothetical protein
MPQMDQKEWPQELDPARSDQPQEQERDGKNYPLWRLPPMPFPHFGDI